MTISQIETALVDLISDCVPDGVDVAPAPGDWDDSYVRNLLTALPAIRVVFDGGAQETPETFISLDSRWVVFVAVGWKGRKMKPRGGPALPGRSVFLTFWFLHFTRQS